MATSNFMVLCVGESGLNYRRFVEIGKNIFAILIFKSCIPALQSRRNIEESRSRVLIKTPQVRTGCAIQSVPGRENICCDLQKNRVRSHSVIVAISKKKIHVKQSDRLGHL